MKPGAIQSAGLKLGLRAFDGPQQPVGLPTLAQPAFLPGPNHLFDFPRDPATAEESKERGNECGRGRGSKGMSPSYFVTECVLPIHFLFIIPKPSPRVHTHTHTHTHTYTYT
ncbi:unnamed protein product [Tetraodon nigroviridis]|uniref:(spotted green pufferfish) hypothetical protein n=1 Tax=Tetraodon nigroviridis TaxID=99883 RepID=Q4SR78_TETNG|nr:unnamed protein product [Tetraodon nigroviridis]